MKFLMTCHRDRNDVNPNDRNSDIHCIRDSHAGGDSDGNTNGRYIIHHPYLQHADNNNSPGVSEFSHGLAPLFLVMVVMLSFLRIRMNGQLGRVPA